MVLIDPVAISPQGSPLVQAERRFSGPPRNQAWPLRQLAGLKPRPLRPLR